MPLYAVYTLLFSDAGLNASRISVLLLIWSATSVVLEIPTGAVADRFTARRALVAAGLLRALAFAVWMVLPRFSGFAGGFVLWGASSALESGAFQSMLYQGLESHGASDRYAAVLGRSAALAGIAEVVATLAAAPLLVIGGWSLVGWASVGMSLCASAVATGFPHAERAALAPDDEAESYVDLLREGVREAMGRRVVRRLVLVVAVVSGMTAVDEYVPLLARGAAIPRPWVPVVMAALPLAAAAGSALAGVVPRVRPSILAALVVGATVGVAVTAAAGSPALLGALGCWWVLVHLTTVLADGRLQDAVRGPARATVGSVAGLSTELVAIAVFLAGAALAR